MNTKSAAATINSLDKESLTKLAEQENTRKLLVTQHRVPTIGRPRDTLHKWYRLPGDGRQRQSELTNTHTDSTGSFESMGAGQSVAKPPEDQDEQVWHDEIFNVEVRGQLCIASCLYIYM